MDVLAMRRQGLSYVEIGETTGYYPATIAKWVRNGGPPPARAMAAEDRRLVVAAPGETGPMQRDRSDQIGLGEQLRSRHRQPAGEARGGVQPIGVLEAEQDRSAVLVIAQRRARPRHDGRRGGAGHAALRRIGREFERRAAAHADRRGDPADAPPTADAEAGRRDRRAARQAELRQDRIQQHRRDGTDHPPLPFSSSQEAPARSGSSRAMDCFLDTGRAKPRAS